MPMTQIRQMNFGMSNSDRCETFLPAVCNCLLIDDGRKLILIDSGFGVREAETLVSLVGSFPELSDISVDPHLPASRQLYTAGYDLERVTDIVLTHLDLDHAGGLKDFPQATVHLSFEEYLQKYDLRYLQTQFEHRPDWRPARESVESWFGFEARSLDISESVEILLVPLPGHTWGHCGVAVKRRDSSEPWILHVGDAYYERAELSCTERAIQSMSHLSAVDRTERLRSLSRLRHLVDQHANRVKLICSHDPSEAIEDGLTFSPERVDLFTSD
jgi:glyoxylase-like metal-dependent hydrolase (beta-lactamase superfamily II)